jgi:hypothetical protein
MTSAVPTTDLIAGRYRLERLLGHGGMADVYRAEDAEGGPPVAVKVVRSTDPELARRLTREARAASSLEHPSLVRILGAGIHDQHAYLLMDLVDGPTLAEQLRLGPLAPDRVATVGTALAEGLACVHRHGIVHRDVKPANVLLGPGSRVRLADFGVAQVLDASAATVTGTTLGTAAYMAPEQLGHHRVGTAADVWALGAVLLECLTGKRGFEGAPAEVVARRLAGAVPSAEGLPAPWRILLASMLETEPSRRPEAAEVAEMLKAPAFTRPWDPRATAVMPAGLAATAAATAATGAAAAAAATADGHVDATAVVPAAAAAVDDGPTTIVNGPPTALAPAVSGARSPRRRAGRERMALVGSALIVLVLLAALIAWALGSSAPARRAASTTTTAAPTTTTTQLTSATAAAALVNDVQQAVASGALPSDVGRTILDELGQALAAAARGDTTQADAALGSIDRTIADASASGTTTAQEASSLLADVARLAAALGVPDPASTTTVPAPGPGGGGGGGGGGGHGGDH